MLETLPNVTSLIMEQKGAYGDNQQERPNYRMVSGNDRCRRLHITNSQLPK